MEEGLTPAGQLAEVLRLVLAEEMSRERAQEHLLAIKQDLANWRIQVDAIPLPPGNEETAAAMKESACQGLDCYDRAVDDLHVWLDGGQDDRSATEAVRLAGQGDSILAAIRNETERNIETLIGEDGLGS